MKPGLLKAPYPREDCQGCHHPLATREAYLFSNLNTGQLGVLCDMCTAAMELQDDTPWKLVAL